MKSDEFRIITLGRNYPYPLTEEFSALFLSEKRMPEIVEVTVNKEEVSYNRFWTDDLEKDVLETVDDYQELLFIDRDIVISIFDKLTDSQMDAKSPVKHGVDLIRTYAEENGIFVSKKDPAVKMSIQPLAEILFGLIKQEAESEA